MQLETLLREELHDIETAIEPPPVAVVKRRAGVRRRRRFGAGVATTAFAIVGVGLMVAPGGREVPSSVFVSEDIGVDETPASIDDAPAVHDAGDAAVTTSRFVALVDEQVAGLEPASRTIVPDGEGGFVGVALTTVRGSDIGGRSHLVLRSDDGETWEPVGEWVLGDRMVVEQMTRTGQGWVATLNDRAEWRTNPVGNVTVAFSDDLEHWRHRSLPLNAPSRLDVEAIESGDVTGSPVVLSAGRVGDRDFAQVAWWVDVTNPFSVSAGRCGSGVDERGLFAIGCDGSIEVLLEPDVIEAQGYAMIELHAGEGDDPFERVSEVGGWPILFDGERLVELRDHTTLFTSTDGVEWTELAVVEPPTDDEWYWLPMAESGSGEVALVGRNADGTDLRMAVVDSATGQMVVRSLPVQADIGTTIGMIDHGAMGWAMVATQQSLRSSGVVDGEWRAMWWDSGASNDFLPLVVAPRWPSTDTSYVLGPKSPNVQFGLFGELRVTRPGTDEVLIDVDDGVTRLTNTSAGVVVPGSGRRYEANGWIVEGDPLRGPLTFTPPNGDEALVVSDGLLFVNGRLDDGVERIELDPERPSLWIKIGDEPALTVALADLLPALGWVEAGDPMSTMAQPGDAWVFTSDDGEAWQVAWEGSDAGFGPHPTIIVGDDEVLVEVLGVGADTVAIALDD